MQSTLSKSVLKHSLMILYTWAAVWTMLLAPLAVVLNLENDAPLYSSKMVVARKTLRCLSDFGALSLGFRRL